MESETKKLVVRLKLRRGLDAKLFDSTHYATILSMLGESFRDGKEHFTHSRLVAYLERKGTMEYCQPVIKPASLPATRGKATIPASVLVGQSTKQCTTCKRCPACQKLMSTGQCRHTKVICPCPFPRRMVPWGKAECAQDKESCDRLLSMLALKIANKEISLEQYTAKRKWIDAMIKRCDSKLFAIRQHMVEAEGLVDPKRTKNSIGRNVEPMGKGLVLG